MDRATVRLLRDGALVKSLEAGTDLEGGRRSPDDLGSGRGSFPTGLGWYTVPVQDQRFPPSARSVPDPCRPGGPRPRPVSRPLVQLEPQFR